MLSALRSRQVRGRQATLPPHHGGAPRESTTEAGQHDQIAGPDATLVAGFRERKRLEQQLAMSCPDLVAESLIDIVARPAGIAQTLALDPNITASTLAPVNPGPPVVSNGAALQLAGLGNSTNPADQISGQTILQFLSSMATQAGQSASDAQTGSNLHAQLLAQSRSLQTHVSGISLDAEAAQVLQLQQGYQAASKMVSVINSLSDALLNMV